MPQQLQCLFVRANSKMKTLLLIIMTFGTISVQSQTPDIKDIQFYLSHPKVSKTAKDFYNKKFKAADNDRTFSIFDSLNTKNSATRPFYIFLCSKIMEKSDGALSEFAGLAAKSFVEEHPRTFMEFFKRPNNLLDTEKYFKIWAEQVAGEIAIECENKENDCLVSTIKKMKLNNNRTDQRSNYQIDQFASLIKNYLP